MAGIAKWVSRRLPFSSATILEGNPCVIAVYDRDNRSCSAPAALFALLHFDGETEDELRACVEEALPQFTNVSADIDGKHVNALEKYRLISGLFDFTLPTDNIFGLPPGQYQAVIGGYFLMHTPFSVGQHVIHFHDELPAIGLVSDVTYMLSVEPHK